MSELINKISSYNLFNYLLPGVIFVIFIENTTTYKVLQENMIINAFLVYFIGLVISRIGSLLIEGLLKKIAPHDKYENFITACQKDSKIEVLSEANNMYRTFISLFLLIITVLIYDKLSSGFREYTIYILLVLLLALFIAAYVKQTKYITKRVSHHCKKDVK